ncbi:MAG TPA: hypothetical protein VH682_10355 [Gemmataceae bacterium]|jgi:hypothetical protein
MIDLRMPVGCLTLVVRCPELLRKQGEFLIELLKETRDQGGFLGNNTTVQFGWSLLRLRQEGSELIVCEPDFDGDAVSGVVPHVTRSLIVQTQQSDVLCLVQAEPAAIWFQDTVLLTDGCLEQPLIFMTREVPSRKGDSGWGIGYKEDPGLACADHYIPLFELVRRRAALLQVMLLPTGWSVNFDGDLIDSIFNPDNNLVWDQSSQP